MRTLAFGVAAALIAGSAPASIDDTDAPAAVTVIENSTLASTPVRSIADALNALPQVSSYRYGDDPTGVATLDRDAVPAASPDLLGVALLDPGSAGYGDLQSMIASYSAEYAVAGQGLDDAHDYALFIATRDGALDPTVTPRDDLWVQTDFLIGWDDLPGWTALKKYPGDTWQGASLALTAQLQPGKPLTLDLEDTANDFASVPFNGFFALGDSWAMAAIDLDTITGYGGADWKYGFASHVHDGSYGSCPTCASRITTYPAVPRMSADLYDLSPNAWVSLTPSVASGVADEGGGGKAWCLWLGILFGAGALGMGAWWYADRRATRPWWPCTVSRRGWERLRGIESPPRACEPQRTRWKSAARRVAQWTDMVGAATGFLAERRARVVELETKKKAYERALKGPRGGGEGQDFASLDGELIRYDDLERLAHLTDADLADARADEARAAKDLDDRKASLAAARADEKESKAAFDACVASGGD